MTVEEIVMKTLSASFEQAATAPELNRQAVHDLRNLFGVVASAKHLLEGKDRGFRHRALLDALGDAAARGGRLTTFLLGGGAQAVGLSPLDVGARLVDLSAMMHACAGEGLELDAQVAAPNSMVRVQADEFDAVILELLANAVAAGARRIIVRNRTVGSCVWILVSDDGAGMTPGELRRARSGIDLREAKGSGLARVHRFAAASHGQLCIRSGEDAGTLVALILPTILSVASPATTSSVGSGRPMRDEPLHRQTATT
jgi:signal transduction histidine kinase